MKSKLLRLIHQLCRRLMIPSGYASLIEVERAERIFYINYLQKGMTVFDVGASIGELSLLFSRFVTPSGKVHAFEACAATFEKLRTVCQLANRSWIVLNHKAVTDKNGIVKLHVYDEEHAGWNSLADRPLHKYGINVKPTYIEEVEATTIDTYCEENKLPRIDLLKIDVEGAEYQVLLGAYHMLKEKRIGCCTFEFGQTTFDMGNTPDEIEDYLNKCGYRIRNIVKGNPVFPGRSSVETTRFSMHVARPKP